MSLPRAVQMVDQDLQAIRFISAMSFPLKDRVFAMSKTGNRRRKEPI